MNGKLRFYLRGLGIGIVVTALILSLVNLKKSKESMSDAEIKARAEELGMVDKNSFSLTQAVNATETDAQEPVVEEPKVEEPAAQESKVEEPAAQESKVEELAAEEPKVEEPAVQEPVVEEPKVEEPVVEEPAAEQPKKEEPAATPPSNGEMVTITVNAGNGSETVAARIKDAGLITDANDFNNYMCKNGYDRVISVGTHSIPVGADYEEICKIISGKK